jgi:hypothetical protein
MTKEEYLERKVKILDTQVKQLEDEMHLVINILADHTKILDIISSYRNKVT